MNYFYRSISYLFISILLFLYGSLFAQNYDESDPICQDSLILITVTGTAIVDTTHHHPLYFLDENGDGSPDYFLNFGPYWYEPDSGNATRPDDGEIITIYGGMHYPINNVLLYPVIIVYEINGEYWRDPYQPYWYGFRRHHHAMGFFFGFLHDTLQTVNLNGLALVDTTFKHNLYFLDENNDSLPDYFLNFGPPWYEPTSGATRPQNGDTINIVGGLFSPDSLMPMIIVYEINGLIWRDSTFFGPHMGGSLIFRYMTQAQYIYSPWDTLCGMRFQPGWHIGSHPSMHMPDSIFGYMFQLFTQNMYQTQSQNTFAGFEIGMYGPMGNNLMSGGPMGGGHLSFNNELQLRFHYNDIQLQGNNIDESSIRLKYWDPVANTWITAQSAILNTAENTVTLYTPIVSQYYILTGTEGALDLNESEKMNTDGFILKQNYPNPFNPTTKISFTLGYSAKVELTVYNLLGQKVAMLLNQPLEPGQYSYNFSAKNLPSGSYFYELKVNGNRQIRKMYLIR